MNYFKEAESLTVKDMIRKMLTVHFWLYMITVCFLILLSISILTSVITKTLNLIPLPKILEEIISYLLLFVIFHWTSRFVIHPILDLFFSKNTLTNLSISSEFLKVTNFLSSSENQKEVFEPIASDWQEEYFEALFKKDVWKSRWINVRYTYAFIVAMWQKSPIGDLIEFFRKVAK